MEALHSAMLELQALEEEAATLHEEEINLRQSLSNARKTETKALRQTEKRQLRLQMLRNKQQQLTVQEQTLAEQLERLMSRQGCIQESVASTELSEQELLSEISEVHSRIHRQEQTVEQLTLLLRKAQQQHHTQTKEKQHCTQRIQELQHKIDALDEDINNYKESTRNTLHHLEIKTKR